jgi:SAM-dependent methyltransferase
VEYMIFQPTMVELRQFYSSELGAMLRRDVGRALAKYINPLPPNSHIVGLGFAVPYLRPYVEKNHHVISLMFSHIGAMYWPADSKNHSILCHESALPLDDECVDIMLLCHAIEHSLHVNTLLSEVHRCLKPRGKALLIVPNRRGLWSARSNNPFGVGHPYHAAQLRHRAELAGLTVSRTSTALFYSPSNARLVLRASLLLEYMGLILAPTWGSVLVMELEKQLYAAIPEPKKVHLTAPTFVPAR